MVFVAPPLTSTTGFTLGNGSGIAMSGGTASLSGSTDGWYPALYTATPVASDAFFAQCTVASTPTSVPSALLIRGNSSTWQQVAVGFGSAATYLIFMTSATASGAVTESTIATVFASGDVCRVTAVPIVTGGTLYTAYQNGASIGVWTDSGATSSSGSAYRLGGLAMQRNSFTNSCSLSTLSIGDLGGLVARPNNVPLYRSALY